MSVRILVGDALAQLHTLPDACIQTCVTSPPYWGLRDYGVEGQIGLERTPEEYVAKIVAVFREVGRVLRDDGTLWVNLGDSYASGGEKTPGRRDSSTRNAWQAKVGRAKNPAFANNGGGGDPFTVEHGLKPKDLVGIPWMVAFALRADGWYLRSDIIWSKPNPMPESVTDRPTKAHEYLFLLSKGERYYYDAAAIAEPMKRPEDGDGSMIFGGRHKSQLAANGMPDGEHRMKGNAWVATSTTRNRRSVWTVATHPYSEAHFATFPPKLIEPCILAGSRLGDTVIDPFLGAGTTALVADRLGRDCIGIELNESYAAMARERVRTDAPLFSGDVA